ncbi:MAG: hypothetical protein WCO17_11840 [Betaproteobacteria bacterium]|jgi:hypothetical protein
MDKSRVAIEGSNSPILIDIPSRRLALQAAWKARLGIEALGAVPDY